MIDYTKSFDKLQQELSSKFAPKKNQSILLADIYNQLDYKHGHDISSLIDYSKRAYSVYHCGNFLEFKLSSDTVKLKSANFCKDRLCPCCQWRRSLKVFSQVSSCMSWLRSHNPKFRYLFATFTLKNCSAADLSETLKLLEDGWRYLYNKSKIKKFVAGSFRALEITYNSETGEYHPHLHVIFAVVPDYFHDLYLSKMEWVDLWQKACNLSYSPSVDIRTVKNGSKGLNSAVAEVSKYAVKGSDILDHDFDTALNIVYTLAPALFNKRLCSFTGVFKKARQVLQLDSVEDGDLVNVEDKTVDDLEFIVVRMMWRAGVYVQI